ncbi:MAG: steroid-22-oyl-CoA synthetase [Actinomycetota bacterium]|nr:steroid-22-oyl-CoA synthetase [Actinomycetota bacterium]
MQTIAELVRARAGDTNVGLRFEDSSWTWADVVENAAPRAALYRALAPADAPFHVGVLLDNIPEFWFTLCGAALAGATVVGINPTRRGAELARDIAHTDCAFVLTESAHLHLFEAAGDAVGSGRLHVVDDPTWSDALAPFAGAPLPEPERGPSPADTFMLIFTSGTTGAPKAVRMGHARLAAYGEKLAEMFGLTPGHDVCYSVMPLFHSNAVVSGFANVLAAGATGVLRRRFSATSFLPDLRRYDVTFFNYVGKPLSYILATPERADDADNPLRIAFGNEAAPLDIDRFARRFDCIVADGYGSTEGGLNMSRTPETPKGSLGLPVAPIRAVILDPDTGEECPRAAFDEHGRLLNAETAIGEIVNPDGGGGFEGYYNNPEADAERMRDGVYWTGDLGYRDEHGFFYFAGRSGDWLRVDGENFAATPVELVLARHPDVIVAAVYAVPAVDVGDEVMAALHVRDDADFDSLRLPSFLAGQSDLSPKWVPRFVRVTHELPSTATQKVLKRVLRHQRWECDDPVWWRPDRGPDYRRLTPEDVATLRARFVERDREHLIG